MKLPLGPVSSFPDRQFRIVKVSNRDVGIYRRDDDFYAILDVCPHRGAPVCSGVVCGTMLPSRPGELEYGLDGYVLRCPWHGWEFDLRSGESVGHVDPRRLKTFPVSVSEGEVFCELDHRSANGE